MLGSNTFMLRPIQKNWSNSWTEKYKLTRELRKSVFIVTATVQRRGGVCLLWLWIKDNAVQLNKFLYFD